MEHVNHPKHYNQHPAGIECIDIIRHYYCDIANAIKYLWRAGLKPEMGKEDAEKEIEDLKKALWYIEDYKSKCHVYKLTNKKRIQAIVSEQTGHSIEEIVQGYTDDISEAISHLLCVGIIRKGEVKGWIDWDNDILIATHSIQHRILDIERSLLDKEFEKISDVLGGVAIDGEDYVSKPGCNRETEPEHYDPLNMIIINGRAYCLTNNIRKKKNGALHTPCENCDLYDVCYGEFQLGDNGVDLKSFLFCSLHDAEKDEYYKEVGIAKYSPSFGTIEVVDEHKEAMLELKRLEEEEEKEDV
jgi:hypothetical protein